MNPPDFSRLHGLRAANDATGIRMNHMRHRFESLRTRHEDGTAPRAVSAFQLFQTPPALAARLVDLAGILPHHIVLEPSAGLGNLLRPVLAMGPAAVHACEIDPVLAGELFHAFSTVTLMQGDFLAREPGSFDRIVMNPPFHMRADVRHVLHARSFLAPGGVLAGLCMAGPHRERDLRPLCDHWEAVPAGTFKDAPGIATVLFRMTV